MKQRTAIVTDTNSGILTEEAAALGIYVVPMPVIVDDETYFEGVTITYDEFFQRLRDGASVSSSQPAPGDLMEIWDKALEDHDAVIHMPMSSGLSASYESAAALAAAEYPGRVYVVNNRRIAVTLRPAALQAKRMADDGVPAAEIARVMERDGLDASIYVTVNTLELLKKSGRVTAAGAAIGTVLNIKPVLQIQGGKLDAYKKVRGMKAAMDTMIQGIKTDRETRFAGRPVEIRATWSGAEEAGETWRLAVAEAFPDVTVEKAPLPISISCHVAEGALGVGIIPLVPMEGVE
ncbi:MAG: DegV family protein [Oscillospiraceae bacterium]|nr:DegV family protein [Oscillospiraceae bacterium]